MSKQAQKRRDKHAYTPKRATVKTAEQSRHITQALYVILLAAFWLRVVLSALTKGYHYDINCFFAWALRMAETGPRGFYAEDYFCDYPPAYLYVLWLVGKCMNLLKLNYLQKSASVLLTFIPTLADCAIAAVLYWVAAPRHGERNALWFAGVAAFCPLLLYDTAVWKQIDGVLALLLLLCFVLLENPTRKNCLWAAFCYGLGLAVKPQALLVGPVLAVCFLRPILMAKENKERMQKAATLVLGVVCALAPVLVCALPFYGFSGLVSGLAERYLNTAESYPYATIDAFNLFAFLGGNWQNQTQQAAFLPISWQHLGILLLVVLTAFMVWLAYKSHKNGRFSGLLLSAVYMIGVFTVSHRMHERYLLAGVVLLLGAAALMNSARLLVTAAGLSFTALLNLAIVYSTVDGDDQFLESAMSTLLMRGAGLAETILFGALVYFAVQWCTGKEEKPLTLRPRQTYVAAPAPQCRWTRREALLLAALTVATAIVSFWNLGDTTAPQNCLDANGSTYRAILTPSGTATELWVYPGISSDNSGTLTVTDSGGNVVLEQELNYTSPFKWTSTEINASNFYLVEVQDGQIFELAFRDANGQLLDVEEEALSVGDGVTGEGCLCDETDLVPDTISYMNSFYFDEIYHARTGYELLHGMKVYETTHPPLGKDFIALGIAIFGMTGFGWRFSGTLFGVLLVPMLYLLVRRLTRKPKLAAFASLILAFDFMRYTQSRLATIDSYVTFFILLGAYCMVWYAQSVLEHGVTGSILPMAAGGIAFGLGCASKWTGIYAGAGWAILYFAVLGKRGVQLCGERSELPRTVGRKKFEREIFTALAGGVLFYVVVPLCIYWASYLPYTKYDPNFGLSDWWRCQTSMYNYHSTLEATHPFASSWYSWLFDLRPVWYYQGKGLADGQFASIAGFLSPVLVWGGAAAMLYLMGRSLAGHGTSASGFVFVSYLSSLLPWLLVTRCTFLYHYFPCEAFLAVAMALCLNHLAHRSEKLARRVGIGVLILAAVLFVWFYPVLSGAAVSRAWAASLKWLPSWGFYIL